ncbi:MAG: hypothetical protein CBD74_11035 [Saprospirales bacterium TMED214]|nr:MAG: hypothetical protein CBD74_11035 [Saprospirales bacterium TMED214]
MTCINRVTFTVMVAFSAPWCWCYGQVLPSASRSQPPELSTNPLPNTDTLPVFSESHNSTNKSEDRLPTRAFGVSLLENSCLLTQDTSSGFVYADAFSSLQDAQPTSSAPGAFPLPAVFQDEPDTDLDSGLVQASFNSSLTKTEQDSADFSEIDAINLQADNIDTFDRPLKAPVMQSSAAYGASGVNSVAQFNVGVDLYGAPDFKNGLLIYGQNVAMKIGGYVKADFIYDFDPIDSTDSFDTTKIPVDALPRTNSRFHARQSRLSFDTRWKGAGEVVKIYVEGDFFSTNDTFRLRQAYGESGRLLVGKSWTAFTDVAAAPATLDFEGSVSAVNRRQAQARYTFPICDDVVTGALSLEDTRFIIALDPALGTSRSPTPDFIGHVRVATDLIQVQAAALFREVGFQPTNKSTSTKTAGGMNFTGVLMLTGRTKAYSQLLFGKGIGSYRSLPDAAAVTGGKAALLPMFGWMFGLTHEWNDLLSSNFTYAANEISNTSGQAADAVNQTTYMAINLLAKPQNRITLGIEYLYGTRTNKDLQSADAHRVQCAVIFNLP